jgi:hypothetical protein
MISKLQKLVLFQASVKMEKCTLPPPSLILFRSALVGGMVIGLGSYSPILKRIDRIPSLQLTKTFINLEIFFSQKNEGNVL